MRSVDIYRRAACLIHTGGLCKGTYKSGSQHCVISAINDVFNAFCSVNRPHQRWAVYLPLWFIADQNGANIFTFNDDPNTTSEHVETLLCFCAAMVEQGYQ